MNELCRSGIFVVGDKEREVQRMRDCKVTIAALCSILIDPQCNLERVVGACKRAHADGARM